MNCYTAMFFSDTNWKKNLMGSYIAKLDEVIMVEQFLTLYFCIYDLTAKYSNSCSKDFKFPHIV